jgi:quinol monooxygenase YgiN
MNPENSPGAAVAAHVKAELKDPAKLFALLVRFQVKDGMREKFEAAFARAIAATRKEQGVQTYELNRDTKDATCYFLNERWKSLSALEDHLDAPYITTLFNELDEILVAAPELHVLIPAGE